MSDSAATFPRISAVMKDDGTADLAVDGVSEPIVGESEDVVRAEIIERVTRIAEKIRRPVQVIFDDASGRWYLIVHPDGRVEESSGKPVPIPPLPVSPPAAVHAAPAAQPAASVPSEPSVAPERAARASFLAEEPRQQGATRGWRGLLAKAGITVRASRAELAERAAVQSVSRHWAGPRTIAIVNGKGGANKTPTTAMLSAVFARYGGSGVLAWDNNETRGALGWRTEKGPHDATVQSLLPEAGRLLSPGAQSSDLAHFVHHQTRDKYDVLRSNPTMLATQQSITTADFDALHSVAGNTSA